jgi:uncharacterized membrane-anchored protein YhcB (DUF1043 family)
MTAQIYRYVDFSTEPSREKLVPIDVLDQLPLEERLPALHRHFDALNERITEAHGETAQMIRGLSEVQARLEKHMCVHAQTTRS